MHKHCKSTGCIFNAVGRSSYCSSKQLEFNLKFKRNNSKLSNRIIKENSRSVDAVAALNDGDSKQVEKGFCNSTIKPLRENKPHIVFINKYWRVSKMPKYTTIPSSLIQVYNKAHCFVNTLNAERFE